LVYLNGGRATATDRVLNAWLVFCILYWIRREINIFIIERVFERNAFENQTVTVRRGSQGRLCSRLCAQNNNKNNNVMRTCCDDGIVTNIWAETRCSSPKHRIILRMLIAWRKKNKNKKIVATPPKVHGIILFYSVCVCVLWRGQLA
jgi:hypothetical protein